jgi:hypothetical protein
MTRSETSTSQRPVAADDGFQPLHFYVLLSMAAATAAVIVSENPHPAALLLLSAAVMAAGLVGYAIHTALAGFLGTRRGDLVSPGESVRETLAREQMLVLRSIKELEFDRDMGKVSEEDFRLVEKGLRARALTLMQDLERAERPVTSTRRPAVAAPGCRACGIVNDGDAKFCKGCGEKL